MKPVNESSVTEEHRISPKQVYEIFRRHISLALGGTKDTGEWGGGHPFDVEMSRIPPGKKAYPTHSHAAQTEQIKPDYRYFRIYDIDYYDGEE